jgi:hypothetical protein
LNEKKRKKREGGKRKGRKKKGRREGMSVCHLILALLPPD